MSPPRTSADAPPCRQYLPPEWAPQSGVMLTWPHPHGDWAARLATVEPVFVTIARAVSLRERVLIGCHDDAHREHVAALLRAAGMESSRVILRVVTSNDTWARDHGPITVLCQNEPTLLDFRFNGWGGKYPYALDDAITRRLYEAGAFGDTPLQTVDLVLEGGSIEVDGSGTLLTTSRCLLAPTRNPAIGRERLEASLKELLGLNRILWLDHGYLAGDDTDSHIDTLARFCDARTIAYVACDDPTDEHYAELTAMEQELRGFRAADGTPYRLVALPWPRAKYNEDGERLPATYANFLIVNGAVLVPTYDDPADGIALDRLKECFPDREIVAIDCAPLIYQYGSLHCVTMQLPAGVLT
jgi:agmatine deiminase